MSADVAALVVRVQDEVQARHVIVRRVHSHHPGEVGAEVEIGIRLDRSVAAVLQAIDGRTDLGQPGPQGQRVLQRGLPVIQFAQALGVGPDVFGLALHRRERGREHRHGVGVARQRVQHVPHVLGDLSAAVELVDHLLDVALRGDVAGQQEIHVSFDVRHLRIRWPGKPVQDLGNGESTEPDAFFGIEVGDIGDQALHAPGSPDGLADGHLRDLDVPVLLHQPFGSGAPSLDLLSESLLEHFSPPSP